MAARLRASSTQRSRSTSVAATPSASQRTASRRRARSWASASRSVLSGWACVPALESLVERHDALGAALVGVRHDALLERSLVDPRVGVGVAEAHDRVTGDRPGELRVPGRRDVLGSGAAVRVAPQRVVVAEGLVDVVEERGRLDEAPVDADAPALGAVGEERRDLGNDGGVLHESWRRVRGQEQPDGLGASRDRHRAERSRAATYPGPPSIVASRWVGTARWPGAGAGSAGRPAGRRRLAARGAPRSPRPARPSRRTTGRPCPRCRCAGRGRRHPRAVRAWTAPGGRTCCRSRR